MRVACGSRRVGDWDFGHTRAVKAGQGWDEAVQLAIQMNLFQYFGAIGFEGSPEIAQLDARGFGHEPVGDARWDLSRQGVIDAIFPPAAGDVVALVYLAQQRWDIFGSMLQVAVHGDDDVAIG